MSDESRAQSLSLRCPHCGSFARIRTSRAVTPLFRELRVQCSKIDGDKPCGHTFVASITIDRTINQSANPNPKIKLPIGLAPSPPLLPAS